MKFGAQPYGQPRSEYPPMIYKACFVYWEAGLNSVSLCSLNCC